MVRGRKRPEGYENLPGRLRLVVRLSKPFSFVIEIVTLLAVD